MFKKIMVAIVTLAATPTFAAEPANVLEGTDIYEMSEYSAINVECDLTGRFGDEQGGSGVVLVIERTGDTWSIQRSLSEPGSETFVASYDATEKGERLIGVNDGVVVVPTEKGVLVWEKNDDVVSPNLWTFLPKI